MASKEKQESGLLSTHTSGKLHLPQPRGQYSVGFVDIMTPGEPELGTFIRLYYPTDEHCLEEHERWPTWTFEEKYIFGIYTFARGMMYRWPCWAPRSEYLFWEKVAYIGKFVPYYCFQAAFKLLFGCVYIPIVENATIKKCPNGRKWPSVVFSHGIGASRFMYSQICYDIASFGFVVAATEHRDGSACISQYPNESENNNSPVMKWMEYRRCEKEENEYTLRNSQVHFRSKEVSRTLDMMLDLNNGKNISNVFEKDIRVTSPEKQPEKSVNLLQFKDSIDVVKPIIAGHSFGGATTILTLAEDKRFKIGIALDAWMFPLRDEDDLSPKIEQPLLFVNTESFLDKRNLSKLSTLEKPPNGYSGERSSLLIRGTVHQNHMDWPLVVQYRAMKSVLGVRSETCPGVMMNLNNKVMVQFFYKHLGLPSDVKIDDEITRKSYLLQDGFGFSDDTPTTGW